MSLDEIFLFLSLFEISLCSNSCQLKKIGIYDDEKFPNSRFTGYKTFLGHLPHKMRIIDGQGISAWNTQYLNDGWVQVHLGETYDIYGLDIRGNCLCMALKFYYTETFLLSYDHNGTMEKYQQNNQDKVLFVLLPLCLLLQNYALLSFSLF